MLLNHDVKLEGGITYWHATHADYGKLKFDWPVELEKYLPKARTPGAALKAALENVFADKRTLIRPLKLEGSFAVVKETVSKSILDPVVSFYCHVPLVAPHPKDKSQAMTYTGADPVFEAAAQPPLDAECNAVIAAFREELNHIPPIAISNSLVDVVEFLGGISLKENGGVYWLADSARPLWDEAANAVENSSVADKLKSKVYFVRTVLDEKSVVAVVDALSREITTTVTTIIKQLGTDIGERARDSKAKQAERLLKKVTTYEAVLDLKLTELREKLDKVVAVANATSVVALAPEEDADGVNAA